MYKRYFYYDLGKFNTNVLCIDLVKENKHSWYINELKTIIIITEDKTIYHFYLNFDYDINAFDYDLCLAFNNIISVNKISYNDTTFLNFVADVIDIPVDEFEIGLSNYITKKMYKDKKLDLFKLRKSAVSRVNKNMRDQNTENFNKAFLLAMDNDKNRYKDFINHTVPSSCNISFGKISDINILYKNIDEIVVEFPIYCINDPEWYNSHKKDMYRYAICKINNSHIFRKTGMKVSDFKLSYVKRDHEFVIFNFILKEENVEEYEDKE